MLDYINIRQGGISIHGGLIAGLLVLVYYAWRHKLSLYRYAELMIPGVALGIVGGRLGNIMNGSDTVGRVTGWPVGYHWPADARGFHDAMCKPAVPLNLAQYCQEINGQLVMTAPVHFTQLYGVLIRPRAADRLILLATPGPAGPFGSSGCGIACCAPASRKPSASTSCLGRSASARDRMPPASASSPTRTWSRFRLSWRPSGRCGGFAPRRQNRWPGRWKASRQAGRERDTIFYEPRPRLVE